MGSNGNYQFNLFVKKAVGDEDGTTVSIDYGALNTMTSFSAQCYRIINWLDTGTIANDVEATAQNNVATNPNPPSLNPTNAGTENILWITGAAAGQDGNPTAPPTNYTHFTKTDPVGSGNRANMATARRELNAASEDPGTFSVSTVDVNWCTFTASVRSAPCPTITIDDTLADGQVGSAYSGTVAASGGSSPYTYAVTAGALPTSVTLAAAGTLSGTPTVANTFTFTITATDANTCTGANSSYSVTIAPLPASSDTKGTSDWYTGKTPPWWGEIYRH
jgi:hypothetical protein